MSPVIRSETSSPTGHSIFNMPSFTPPLRPTSSAANLESARIIKTPPLAEAEDHVDHMALPRAESRTIVGSYMQKTIPFRSASFSQVDYSSGKYIRSALNALKASVSHSRTHSVVESANLTLPRKKDGSRSASPSNVVGDADSDRLVIDTIVKEPSEGTSQSDPVHERSPRVFTDLNLNLAPVNVELTQRKRPPGSGQNTSVIIEEDYESSPTIDAREMHLMPYESEVVATNDVKQPDNLSLPPLQVVQASEIELNAEEGALHSPKPLFHGDEILQTATQCLIPVPVYECAVHDWTEADMADRWINACEVETSKIIEGIHPQRVNIIADVTPAATESNEEKPDREEQADEGFKLPATVEEQNNLETLATQPDQSEISQEDSNKETVVELRQPGSDPVEKIEADEPTGDQNQTAIEPLARPKPNRDSQKTNSLTLELDDVPAISVTPGSSISGSSFDETTTAEDKNQKSTESERNSQTDYVVEVRKRHSNEGRHSYDKGDNHSGSGSGSNSPKPNPDEKRRIDKSKRRKGIYIQWAAIDQAHRDLSTISWNEGDEKVAVPAALVDDDSSPVAKPVWSAADAAEKIIRDGAGSLGSESEIDFAGIPSTVLQPRPSIDQQSEGLWLKCQSPDDGRYPPGGHGPIFEPNTPDSEYGSGRPVWPRSGGVSIRRQSLSLQSSEEKDDSPTNSSPSSKPHHKLFVLRSDSISDNEMSDRTPPSRDRTSQSPAPGEQDLRRYSKRPLRGPYGQMLEAEMKKPAKTNYDGLLDALNRSER